MLEHVVQKLQRILCVLAQVHSLARRAKRLSDLQRHLEVRCARVDEVRARQDAEEAAAACARFVVDLEDLSVDPEDLGRERVQACVVEEGVVKGLARPVSTVLWGSVSESARVSMAYSQRRVHSRGWSH